MSKRERHAIVDMHVRPDSLTRPDDTSTLSREGGFDEERDGNGVCVRYPGIDESVLGVTIDVRRQNDV